MVTSTRDVGNIGNMALKKRGSRRSRSGNTARGKYDPSRLSADQMAVVLREIQDIVWPRGGRMRPKVHGSDEATDRDLDAFDGILTRLVKAGLGPGARTQVVVP